MRAAPDFDQITPNIVIWHAYDSVVKADLYSTCLATSDGIYFIDPIRLQREALDELTGSGRVAGIIVTNSNHHRASTNFAGEFLAPVLARGETFPGRTRRDFRGVADGDAIADELCVLSIEGAPEGEIALHYALDGGTFIIGDALINFEPYGFTLLPAKYCSNQKDMRRSLQKLLDYKAERIFFAHGTPILSGAWDRLCDLLKSDL